VPVFTGLKVFDHYDLAELVPYIDWTPFFRSWDLAGVYPKLLQDKTVGEAATTLYQDARVLLERIVAEHWFQPCAVIGFWRANSTACDDVQLFADSQSNPIATFCMLRQQIYRDRGRCNYALSDFIAPVESGLNDYLGAFAVTAGHGVDQAVARFESNHDDYNAIMVKALADRFAEAFAERLHQRVRTEFWGYAPREKLDNRNLIKEQYAGIRPAPGYPACPDHTEKGTLFRLLQAQSNAGISLTESYAMYPAASVSGFYFSHPDSRYFGVSKVERDQVDEYARRKDMTTREVERWLAPVLGYDSSLGIAV